MNSKRSILVKVGVSGPALAMAAKASAAPVAAPAVYAAGVGAVSFTLPLAWPLAIGGLALLLSICAGLLFLLAWRDRRSDSRQTARQSVATQAASTARADNLLAGGAAAR
jgi:hypothetical protein